ncbi:MAG: Na+/H+ antiporter NhaA, partial [Kineosporiaceae bacterium]
LARRGASWCLLVNPALLTWVLVHAGGVHATVAGVLLAFVVPARPGRGAAPDSAEPDSDTPGSTAPGSAAAHSAAERYEHALRPVSAGVAVPLFAFSAAGVALNPQALASAAGDPVVAAIVAGLVLGKPAGVFGGTYLMARFTRAELDPDLSWADIVGVSLLSGIGFTVSLLIGELAFGSTGERIDHVRTAVLAGTLLAALAAAVVLRRRNTHYRARERVGGTPDAPSPDRT